MLRKVASFLAIVMMTNIASTTVFADTSKYSVTFHDAGLSGAFAQGTACGEGGTSYGTTTTIDGNLYVTETDLVTSDNIEEGQYFVGSPNAVPYDALSKDEQSFLKAYKGYRYRVVKEDEDEEISYDYYAFRGWLVESTGTGQTHNGEIVKPGSQIMITADTNLTAQWGADVNRNGVADVDEGDFEVLYMPGRDSDGSSSWVLEQNSLPPSYKVMAEVPTPIQPYYEITSMNDPEDEAVSVAISEVSATYLPKLDEEYSESKDLHKAFAGWEYDLTSVGQNEETITEAPQFEDDGVNFELIVDKLYEDYYAQKMYNDHEEEFEAAMSSIEEYNAVVEKYSKTYRAKAESEAAQWFSKSQTVYNLQPGTKGIIKVREWVDSEKKYKYLLPAFTANTNVVLRAVWEDDLNGNDIPDEEESLYSIVYQNEDTGFSGTLPTDSNKYLPGQQFDVQPMNGKVAGKIFMGWVDSYWDHQYNLSQNPTMEYYGYAGKYPNKFRLYVSSSDMNWADAFENRWSYIENGSVIETIGKSTVGDGTVPHNYEESEAGETFPVYDEDGLVAGTSYFKNTIETGDKEGQIVLTAWWEDDKNNNNIPDIIEPQNKVQFKYVATEVSLADEFVGTTNTLNNLDDEEDAELIEAYLSGEKKLELTGEPADMTSFTGSWVSVPKDDQVLGTDAFVPALTPECKSELKLIFKDWLYVTSAGTVAPATGGAGVVGGVPAAASIGGAFWSKTSNGSTQSPEPIESRVTELNPGDMFKLVEDVYMVAVWYNDVNDNDKADELETKYTIKYTAGTTDNVTNLPPEETNVLSGLEHTVAEAVPYRSGYSFTGWKCSIDNNIYKADQTFDMPEDSVVMEATWAKTTYLLTYLDKDGHIITAYNYADGQNVALLRLDDFDETEEDEDGEKHTYHYTFTGWEDLATGQNYSTSYAMPNKNVTLQAYYTKTEVVDGKEIPTYYHVSYNADTSDVVTDIPVDVYAYADNALVIVSYTVPVRTGWIFKGWSYNGETYQPGGHITINKSDVEFKAVWEEDKNNQQSTSESSTESSTESESTESQSENATSSETESQSEISTEISTENSTETESGSEDDSKVAVYQDPQVSGGKVVVGDRSTYPTTAAAIRTYGFTIKPNPLGVKVDGEYVVYTYQPTVTVEDKYYTKLTENTNYKISYEYDVEESELQNVESANGWVIIKGLGKYEGGIVMPFKYVKPSQGVLKASNADAVDLSDFSTYPTNYSLSHSVKTNVIQMGNKKNGNTVSLSASLDSNGNVVANSDIAYFLNIPESYGGLVLASGETVQPGKLILLTEGTDYEVTYVKDPTKSKVVYAIVTGKGVIDGTVVYPLRLTSSSSEEDDQKTTNVTGNAKNNITNKNMTNFITFSNSYFDNSITAFSLNILKGSDFDGLFEDDEQEEADVNIKEVKAGGQTVTAQDYYKIIEKYGDIGTESGAKFTSLGMYNNAILTGTENATGITMSVDLTASVGSKVENSDSLAVDVLPILKKDLYDGVIDEQATVRVLYNSDAYSEDSERVVIGTLKLSDLDYNEFTVNGETYITPMWQTIVCDISKIEKSSTPTITVALLIPNYKRAAADINSFKLGVSNLRYGSASSDPSGYEQEYVINQPGLNMEDASTIPVDISKKVVIEGIEVTPNPIGTISTTDPSNIIKVKNSETGETLEKDVDYSISVRYSEEKKFGLVVITGKSNYYGVAVLPFAYSENAVSPTESSTETTSEVTTKSNNESTTKTTVEPTTETTTTTKDQQSNKVSIGVNGYNISYGDTSTYPKSTSTTYTISGISLSPAKIGEATTTSPKVTVKDKSSGVTLTADKDYKLTYDWTGKGTSSDPYFMVIEGLNNYTGFVAIPFSYSKTESSSSKSSSGGGGGGSASSRASLGLSSSETGDSYKVTYLIGEFGKSSKATNGYFTENYNKNSEVKLPSIDAVDGYSFIGWSTSKTESNLIETSTYKITRNLDLYAIFKDSEGNYIDASYVEVTTKVETTTETTTESRTERTTSEEKTDEVLQHDGYMSGYNDGSFRPKNAITRAEACSVLAKVLGLNMSKTTSSFSDVPSNAWYTSAVEAIKDAGITTGYQDGTFRPNNSITRAEFVTLIAKAKGLSSRESKFSDISDSWAYPYICAVAQAGWISGYNDGTFHPNENITRAEVVVVFNKMLGRTPDQDYIKGTYETIFNDVSTDYWGYAHIFEATRTHYIKSADFTNSNETWVGFN